MVNDTVQMSPREVAEHDWAVEQFDKQAAHAITIKNLELEILREKNQAEIKLRELESKWKTWLKLPKLIVLLPVYMLFGIAYIFAVCFKYQPPKPFWKLLE